MFQSINRKLHSVRTRLHVSTKNIPTLYPSYSDQFNLSTVGVDPDDTQKHITLDMTSLDV
jgi:hypothetical protein